jgi:hypothetical protein
MFSRSAIRSTRSTLDSTDDSLSGLMLWRFRTVLVLTVLVLFFAMA